MAEVIVENASGTGWDSPEFINIFLKSKYWSQNDLMTCRLVSQNWKTSVSADPKFQAGLHGKIVDKWYKDIGNREKFENTLRWNSCTLFHFQYRGKHVSFKNYWHSAGSLLKELIISNCSMECDGFELLLGQCPVLETLVLSRSQFRDLDDFHNNAKFHQGYPAAPAAPPVTRGLRHLTVEHVYKIEQCFMDYLNQRTGSLESLTLQHCFFDPMDAHKLGKLSTIRHNNKFQKAIPPPPTLDQRFSEFERNLCSLLIVNANTLKKVGLHLNKYQNRLFTTLVDKIGPIGLPELALTFLPDEPDYGPAILLVNNFTWLEKLTLNFEGTVSGPLIADMTRRHRATLHKLELSIVGNRVDPGPIELRELNGFQALQCLKIQDSKTLYPNEIRPVYAGRRLPEGRDRFTNRNENMFLALLNRLDSKIDPGFLSNLPPNLTQLSINKYMAPQNFTRGLAGIGRTLESFKKLTKLEIQGPWVHSFREILSAIAKELTQLETLILTDLGILDEHITGLPEATVKKIRQCMTLGLVMDFSEQPQAQDVKKFEKLKYLDLSKNVLLSDVSLMEGMSIPGLETLHLNNCYRMTDTSLEVISRKFPNLLELGLLHCSKFSGVGLQKVVEKCRKIHSIYCTRRALTQIAGQAFAPANPNYNDIVKIVKSTPEYDYEGDLGASTVNATA